MLKQGKLELTWVGKYEEKNVEPRILVEDKTKSYGDPSSENILIHGDNLIALKALEQEFEGRIKCIYIDPPYNTGSAFEHYDDGVEHSIWLTMMKERLSILYRLLSDDGFIFVQIDNNEMAYLKLLLDEIFGRGSFVNDIIWKRRGGSANPKDRLNNVTDYILWYSKTSNYSVNHIFSLDDENTQNYIEQRFNNVDENGRRFMKSPIQSPNYRENLIYDYKGYKTPVKGYSISKELMEQWDKEGRLWFPKEKTQNINRKIYLDEYKGQPIGNLWTDIKVINPMSKERLDFVGQKPEELISRIISLATKEGDYVLDSFAGTGTTGATAHKMNRKWIMVELGDQYNSFIIPRLQKIIDGLDEGGISRKMNWTGGGGFKFYELAESLLVKNSKLPIYSLNPNFTFDMIAEAICKIEGFKYKPYGRFHGESSERRFIHVTVEYVNSKYVYSIMSELETNQSLLIYCTKMQSGISLPDNVEIRRIPKDLLEKCNFESEGM